MQLFIFRNLHHSSYRLAVLAKTEDEAKKKLTEYVNRHTFVETNFVLNKIAGKLREDIFSIVW